MRASLGLLLSVLPALMAFSWADLRPKALKSADPAELSARELKGRGLLQRVAAAHGAEAFEARATFSVEATDRWESSSSWWPGDQQRFRANRVLGTFDSQVTLLDGEDQGEIWGIQDWETYRGAPAVFTDDDTPISFYLPTLQYFDELPFRLLEAEHTLSAGTSASGHLRVFVTWGAMAAHRDADHYVVYIDPETYRIDRVSYTIREARDFSSWVLRGAMKSFAVGTCHFRDVRQIGGVLVAFDQIVTLGRGERSRPPEEHVFHRVTVHHAAFDEVAVGDVLADPNRPRGDGSKP